MQGKHLDVERAWEIVRGLAESPLVVQGPPGSGKTWMGARLIVRLMREGRVVGVTAPTHRVIHHLLDEVEKVALEEGVEFKGVKKCRDSEGESAFESKVADGYQAFGSEMSRYSWFSALYASCPERSA